MECRKKGFYSVGFLDPYVVHEHNVTTNARWTEYIIYEGLDAQHTCEFILLPYNFG